MKKYNLSSIMKKAWETYKLTATLSFSECLKRAWAAAKSTVTMFAREIILNVVRNEEIIINMATGVISGKTYNARKFIKDNFAAKWDSTNKVWTADVEKIKSEFTACADYYKKYVVEQKEIAHEKLVNRGDGFYNLVTYTDGSTKLDFVG